MPRTKESDIMKDATPQNPAEIAKEAFRRLAVQRITPTPEAYRAAYEEIAGLEHEASPERILSDFATSLSQSPGELSLLGKRLGREAHAANWQEYQASLQSLLQTVQQMNKPAAPTTAPVSAASSPASDALTQQSRVLRELLHRTLTFAVATLLSNLPELAAESSALGLAIKEAKTETELNDAGNRLKQLCFRIELKSGDINEQQEMLLRLFRLLLDNIAYLLDDDSWLRGQIQVVQTLIEGPINHRSLEDASQSLKEVIYKQGTLRDSLSEAKITVKNMIAIFIDRLGSMAASTGDSMEKWTSIRKKSPKRNTSAN